MGIAITNQSALPVPQPFDEMQHLQYNIVTIVNIPEIQILAACHTDEEPMKDKQACFL